MFCQELKTVLKQAIGVWNEYHKGTKVFEDLVKKKERTISRMVELLSLAIKHKDRQRVRKRIIKFNQELFTFLDNPHASPTNNRAKAAIETICHYEKDNFRQPFRLGASNQAVTMSIIQTGILDGIEPSNISLALSVKPLTSFTELPKIRSPWIEEAKTKPLLIINIGAPTEFLEKLTYYHLARKLVSSSSLQLGNYH